MNEEIDIIELLKRVKEGNAPKLIQIGKEIYHIKEENLDLRRIYETVDRNYYWDISDLYIDTPIKILDKPIIEELPTTEIVHNFEDNSTYEREKTYSEDELADKINEIVKFLNNKE